MPATSISIRNDFSELPRLTGETERFLGAAGAAPAIIQTADLVLEEVVTNVIKYGFDDGAEHRIEISLDLENSGLIVSVTDEGKEFNPLAAPEPDLTAPIEQREIGGLGLLLVRRLMDAVEYRREGNKNILVMRKKFGGQPEPAR